MENRFSTFTAQVFAWMSGGLLLTAIISFFVYIFAGVSDVTFALVVLLAIPAAIMQVILAIAFGFFWQKMSGPVAVGAFMFYALFSGLSLGLITMQYDVQSIFLAFGITVGAFAILFALGSLVKVDLTGLTMIALFGLIAVVLASMVNLILFAIGSPLATPINMVINYVTAGIFMVLIFTNAQRIKMLEGEYEASGQQLKYVVQGALIMYVDMINLFIRILMIFGRRRR